MLRTDNPIHDFHVHDAEQEAKLNKLPKCYMCEEHIQQESAVYLFGRLICDDCLNKAREFIR